MSNQERIRSVTIKNLEVLLDIDALVIAPAGIIKTLARR